MHPCFRIFMSIQLPSSKPALIRSLFSDAPQRGLKVHFSSKSNEWAAPQWLFDELNREFRSTLDPCSTHQKCQVRSPLTSDEDGLSQSWAGEVVFMNPPYGREIWLWMRKTYLSALEKSTVVCLVPSRTDRLVASLHRPWRYSLLEGPAQIRRRPQQRAVYQRHCSLSYE